MSQRDKYHDPCKAARIKDGWVVTNDPLRLEYGGKKCTSIWEPRR